jgi:hypothetical protein
MLRASSSAVVWQWPRLGFCDELLPALTLAVREAKQE